MLGTKKSETSKNISFVVRIAALFSGASLTQIEGWIEHKNVSRPNSAAADKSQMDSEHPKDLTSNGIVIAIERERKRGLISLIWTTPGEREMMKRD